MGKLKNGDYIVEMDVISDPKAKMLVVMENGLGKITSLSAYRNQKRGGSGVKTANLTKKTGDLVGAVVLENGYEPDLLLLSRDGQVLRLNIKDIPTMGRSTQGVYVMRMNDDDVVTSLSALPVEEQEMEMEEAKESVEMFKS